MTAARLRDRFAACAKEGRPALVVYLTQGDPTPKATVEIVIAAAEAGADVIELGVPFSDPSADGPVIQAAMERALAAGGSLPGTLDAIREVRARGCDVPIVLFGYYNPLFVTGVETFAARAADAGVDAVLTVDLPIDEIEELRVPLAAHGVGVVPLVAPTSTDDRIARVKALDPPFVYYISLTGVTGAAIAGAKVGAERIEAVKRAVGAPVVVGFGIKTPADAAAIGKIADGVVVGSAIVQRIADSPGDPASAVGAFVRDLRGGLR